MEKIYGINETKQDITLKEFSSIAHKVLELSEQRYFMSTGELNPSIFGYNKFIDSFLEKPLRKVMVDVYTGPAILGKEIKNAKEVRGTYFGQPGNHNRLLTKAAEKRNSMSCEYHQYMCFWFNEETRDFPYIQLVDDKLVLILGNHAIDATKISYKAFKDPDIIMAAKIFTGYFMGGAFGETTVQHNLENYKIITMEDVLKRPDAFHQVVKMKKPYGMDYSKPFETIDNIVELLLKVKNQHETRQKRIEEHNKQTEIQLARAEKEMDSLRQKTDKKCIIYHDGQILRESDSPEELYKGYCQLVQENVGAVMIELR